MFIHNFFVHFKTTSKRTKRITPFSRVMEPSDIAEIVHVARQRLGDDGEEIDVENALLQGKELSHEEIVSLREHLSV